MNKLIIGLGTEGCNMVEYFYSKQPNQNYLCIYNHTKPKVPELNCIYYNVALELKHLIVGFNPNKEVELPNSIFETLQQNSEFILLGSLGSIVGSQLISNVSQLLIKANRPFKAICRMPFSFEGSTVKELAFKVENRFNDDERFIFIDEKMQKRYSKLPIEMAISEVYKEKLKFI